MYISLEPGSKVSYIVITIIFFWFYFGILWLINQFSTRIDFFRVILTISLLLIINFCLRLRIGAGLYVPIGAGLYVPIGAGLYVPIWVTDNIEPFDKAF